MHVNDINTNNYTHIHFAFANVTKGDFKVEITDAQVKKEFESFKAMTGVQKIISLGGWAFSTEPGTYSVLRDAAKPANRETFKNNLVSFMNENNLDGIDLDWEYPGVSRKWFDTGKSPTLTCIYFLGSGHTRDTQ